jgi:hypothetical protein
VTVVKEYHDFISLFKKTPADKLPPHRMYDHTINLKPGFEPPFDPLEGMSREELLAPKECIQENMSKGFNCASLSSAGAPILFICRKDGTLLLCVDY